MPQYKLPKKGGKIMDLQICNSKAQIDYVFINKKWKNSAINCKACSSFEGVSSDHWILTAKIRLSLRKNATQIVTTKHYDLALLNNRDIRDKYVVELRNRFEILPEKTEKDITNDEYENFVNAYIEAAAKCIPTKPRTMGNVSGERKTCTRENSLQKLLKEPNKHKCRKLKTAQYQLAGIYIKEQTEYIQNQIDKIRESVEDRQSRILFTNPSARAGYDTRSIFKRSLTGLNSEFSFS